MYIYFYRNIQIEMKKGFKKKIPTLTLPFLVQF